MQTVVSITPTKVEADSRTFKQATSMKRFGFCSIVVEGEASQIDSVDLPFELRTISDIPPQSSHALSYSGFENTMHGIYIRVKTVFRKLHEILPSPVRELLEFVLFIKYYFNRFFLLPIRFIPRASLYYMHSPVFIPAVYCLSKRYNVPIIYDAHDFYTGIEKSSERSRFERRWIDPFYEKIEKFCMSRAEAVVTTSEGFAMLQEQAFGIRSIVIRNCQDSRLEKSPRQHLRQLVGLSLNDFLLVTIGQAKKGMAVREVFEALLQLPSWVHLALVGRNQDQYLEDIGSSGMEKRIHVVQPVKPFEVISFVKSADASLIPYYARSLNYENFLPNGFFQSIGAELPILYPELREIRKLAEAYELGIPIDPLDPGSIVKAVRKLIDDPGLRLRYRENVRRAREDLSWEKEEIVLQDLILKVLEHG